MMVQDIETGVWYDPQVEFDKLINSQAVKEIMIRLKNR